MACQVPSRLMVLRPARLMGFQRAFSAIKSPGSRQKTARRTFIRNSLRNNDSVIGRQGENLNWRTWIRSLEQSIPHKPEGIEFNGVTCLRVTNLPILRRLCPPYPGMDGPGAGQ